MERQPKVLTMTATQSSGLDKVQAAAEFLSSHSRGRRTLKALHANLLDHLRGLDQEGRDAYLTLLNATWGEYAGTAPEIIKEVLEGEEP